MFTPYKGLDNFQLDHIRQNLKVFQHAQAVTNVPWEALAGIWFRESFSVASPKTKGGPMQFDPVPGVKQVEHWLHCHTHLSAAAVSSVIERGINHFDSALTIAGCFLQEKMTGSLNPNAGDSLILQALWAYNGKVHNRPEDSAYVYNGFDEAHFPMKLIGTLPNQHGGRRWISISDCRPGAYVVYKQLKSLLL